MNYEELEVAAKHKLQVKVPAKLLDDLFQSIGTVSVHSHLRKQAEEPTKIALENARIAFTADKKCGHEQFTKAVKHNLTVNLPAKQFMALIDKTYHVAVNDRIAADQLPRLLMLREQTRDNLYTFIF